MTARNYYGAGQYEVTSPSGKKFRSGIGRYWRSSYENFLLMEKNNRIWWGPNGNNMPAQKRFLSEVKKGIVPQTLWEYTEVGHTQDAKKQLLEFVHFENTENVLNTVKPTKLLRRIINIGTLPNNDDIVMDFFSGSASMAHAIMEQNEEDEGNRKFILVQFPEQLPKPEKKLNTIADIGKERIRNFIKKVLLSRKDVFALGNNIDLGFKCLNLCLSHFIEWQPFYQHDTTQLELRFHQAETPLVVNWKPDNLLVEILLLQGFSLDSRIRPMPELKENIVNEVSSDFCQHRLYVCLDKEIQRRTIADLHIKPDDIIVCLDNALSDESKITLADQSNLKVI
jgi:adenine-specific DNA-methyltransferase